MVKILSNPPNASELEMSQTPNTYWKMSVFSPKNMDKWRLWVPMVGDFLLECHRHPSVAGHTSRSKWVGLIWDLTDLSKICDVILLVKNQEAMPYIRGFLLFGWSWGCKNANTQISQLDSGPKFCLVLLVEFCMHQSAGSFFLWCSIDARRLHQEMVVCFCSNYDLFLSQNMVPIDIHWLSQY